MFWLIFFVSLLSASVIGQDSEPQDILEIGSKRHHHPSLDFCVRQSIESIITKTSSERLRSWLSCVRQINRPKAEGLGEGDEENEKEFRHNKTRTKIGYWRARKNLSASVRSVDISEVKSYGPMEEDDLFGFGASGTAEPVPNMNDVVDGVTRGLQDVEKTDITFVACWTDTPYGQLNNFLVSTIHALLAAHDAGRTLAVLDRIPCNSADGFALADLLDISALHAVMGTRSITIFPCALYAETCAAAPVAPLSRLSDFDAHAVRIDAADAFRYRRAAVTDLRRIYAGLRFPVRVQKLAAHYVRATFGSRPFGAVHLRTCADALDRCSRFPCTDSPAAIAALAAADARSRIRSTARELRRRRGGGPVPLEEAEAAVAPMCRLDPAWVAAAVASRLPPPRLPAQGSTSNETAGGAADASASAGAAAAVPLFVMDDRINASLTARWRLG